MPNHTFLPSFWEGFQIVKSHRTVSLISPVLKPNSEVKCLCGLEAEAIHEYQWRYVKEAILLGVLIELFIQTRRVKCRDYDIKKWSAKYKDKRHPKVNRILKKYLSWINA